MLGVEDAARFLAVHPETIRRMIKRGELAAVKVARHWKVPEAALVALASVAPQAKEGEATPTK
jgi:excisionase family DNA binding protein